MRGKLPPLFDQGSSLGSLFVERLQLNTCPQYPVGEISIGRLALLLPDQC